MGNAGLPNVMSMTSSEWVPTLNFSEVTDITVFLTITLILYSFSGAHIFKICPKVRLKWHKKVQNLLADFKFFGHFWQAKIKFYYANRVQISFCIFLKNSNYYWKNKLYFVNWLGNLGLPNGSSLASCQRVPGLKFFLEANLIQYFVPQSVFCAFSCAHISRFWPKVGQKVIFGTLLLLFGNPKNLKKYWFGV